MVSDVVDLDAVRAQKAKRRARISVSLRNVSRECRKEILSSIAFYKLANGQLTLQQYADLLYTNLCLREKLEQLFTRHNGCFRVVNLDNNEVKYFDVHVYATPERMRTEQLRADLAVLNEHYGVRPAPLSVKGEELLAYIDRVNQVYSVALLGILYMLEETVIYAGPRIARALVGQVDDNATHYLRGNEQQKKDLWAFRRSLDYITDFQSQANIVIAATISYRKYHELLDLRVPQVARLNF